MATLANFVSWPLIPRCRSVNQNCVIRRGDTLCTAYLLHWDDEIGCCRRVVRMAWNMASSMLTLIVHSCTADAPAERCRWRSIRIVCGAYIFKTEVIRWYAFGAKSSGAKDSDSDSDSEPGFSDTAIRFQDVISGTESCVKIKLQRARLRMPISIVNRRCSVAERGNTIKGVRSSFAIRLARIDFFPPVPRKHESKRMLGNS